MLKVMMDNHHNNQQMVTFVFLTVCLTECLNLLTRERLMCRLFVKDFNCVFAVSDNLMPVQA